MGGSQKLTALVLIETTVEGQSQPIAVSVSRDRLVGVAQSRHLSTDCRELHLSDKVVVAKLGVELAIEEVEFL